MVEPTVDCWDRTADSDINYSRNVEPESSQEEQNMFLAEFIQSFGQIHGSSIDKTATPQTMEQLTSNKSQHPADELDFCRELSMNQSTETRRTIQIQLNPLIKNNFGRSATVSEVLLGFRIKSYDGQKCTVCSFMPNIARGVEHLAIGDWIQMINSQSITLANFDAILLGFADITELEFTVRPYIPRNNSQKLWKATSLSNFINICYEPTVRMMNVAEPNMKLNLLILSSNSDSSSNSISFSYPRTSNCLYQLRGLFETLGLLLKSSFGLVPQKLLIRKEDGTNLNISFKINFDEMMILQYTSKYETLYECNFLIDHIWKFMQYTNNSIHLATINTKLWQNLLTILANNYSAEMQMKQLNTMTATHCPNISKDIRLKIDGTLNALESMTHTGGNPSKTQRDFYIVGSLLFHKSYLLASHLSAEYTNEIQSVLHVYGLVQSLELGMFKNLLICHEIYPNDQNSYCHRKLTKKRFFLLIMVRKHTLLAVVLIAKGNYLPKLHQIDCFSNYIEEISKTLNKLNDDHIDDLIQIQALKIRAGTNQKIYSFKNDYDNRNFEMSSNDLSNIDCSSSDSMDDIQQDNTNSMQNIYTVVSNDLPQKIIAGKTNTEFIILQIDVGQVLLLSTLDVNLEDEIVHVFRQTALSIHKIFQSTKGFRVSLSKDNSQPKTNKPLVAIKEHGVLVNVTSHKTNSSIDIWVIGRLFFPKYRELYVCHLSSIPQTLIEIAFRIGHSSLIKS